MSEYLTKREKALEEAVHQLARIRRCSRLEAWQDFRNTAKELMADSVNTPWEDTWRIDLEIADRRIQSESGFSDLGAERRWE